MKFARHRQWMVRFIAIFLALAVAVSPAVPTHLRGETSLHLLQQVEDSTNDGGVTGSPGSIGGLAREDLQRLYVEAQTMLDIGMDFRTNDIQILPSDTITNSLLNYESYRQGELFVKFCSDYDNINSRGYCAGANPDLWPTPNTEIRNQLVRARERFSFLSVAGTSDLLLKAQSCAEPCESVRELGKRGVIETTREIAFIHLMFGNEFLVDALDFKFSGDVLDGQLIIEDEIEDLNKARQQFSLALDDLSLTFNINIGGIGVRMSDYFTKEELALFGLASERLLLTLNELGLRYRQLRSSYDGVDESTGRRIDGDTKALNLFTKSYKSQYILTLALAHLAQEKNIDFYSHGGWEMIANLEQMRAQAQAIHDGFNPFGYPDNYVPLQSFEELRERTLDTFLRLAKDTEKSASDAQREFEGNITRLRSELRNLRTTYESELLDICGQSENYAEECGGSDRADSLMHQNFLRAEAAELRIKQIRERLLAIPERVQIENERAGATIDIILDGKNRMAALDYSLALISSYSVSESSSTSKGHSRTEGTSTSVGASAGISIPPAISFGVSRSTSKSKSESWSTSTSKGHSKSWNPNSTRIANLTSLRTMRQATERADIEKANSDAVVKTILLEEADLLIEYDIAIVELNAIHTEHNQLVNRYLNLLNLREQARDNLVASYLTNPAFRLVRDDLTVKAALAHNKAAHFAYLSAKALEYRFLSPIPFMDDIFEARTALDIDLFLRDLDEFEFAIERPLGQYEYEISIASDILGLSDENLKPVVDSINASEAEDVMVADLRFEQFQGFLQQHVSKSETTGRPLKVEFQFTISLLDNSILEPGIWNNRIAGIGQPLPQSDGVAINIISRQLTDAGTPRVRLEHGGNATYRTIQGNVIEFNPDNARRPGYPLPDGFTDVPRSALINASVGGAGGTRNRQLLGLSPATAQWTVSIDLLSPSNQDLVITEIEDIEIYLDTTGFAR